jgi:hypothetical protein
MAVLSLQSITAAGLAATYSTAAGGGDKIPLGASNIFLHVKNGGASPVTVTITTQSNSYKGLTVPDRTVTIANATDKFIGPIDSSLHADINQQAAVGYSAVTSVTVAALRI